MDIFDGRVALGIDVALTYRFASDTTILLAIEALSDAEQRVDRETLTINGQTLAETPASADGRARYRWVRAPAGPFSLRYRADVVVTRSPVNLFPLPATLLADLPGDAAPWLFASRHCDPTLFERVLMDEVNLPIGWVADGSTILAIRDWIRTHLAYQPVSTAETTAADSFVARAGVCRDFAHLMIALARAAGVPARFVSAYAWQLEPPDFHAVAEVWLDGRWHLVDATGLAPEQNLIRIARTSDAVDASFMTVFGSAEMVNQRVTVTPLSRSGEQGQAGDRLVDFNEPA